MDKNLIPLITVLMPVYNCESYIKEAIESILLQTFTDFEFIIINDGSSDSSEQVVQSFSDERIRYYNNKINKGLIYTLNRGLKLAQGKYIARMDADDISLPHRLEKQFKFMEINPQVGLCGSFIKTFPGKPKVLKYPGNNNDLKSRLLFSCPFAHPSTIIRRETLVKNGFTYNARYKHAEDYELWLRMSRVTDLANIPSILLLYRLHDKQVSHEYKAVQDENSYLLSKIHLSLLYKLKTKNDFENFYAVYHKLTIEDEGKLVRIHNWLLHLLNLNETENIFPHSEFEKTIRSRWLSITITYPNVSLRRVTMYFNSILKKSSKEFASSLLRIILKKYW